MAHAITLVVSASAARVRPVLRAMHRRRLPQWWPMRRKVSPRSRPPLDRVVALEGASSSLLPAFAAVSGEMARDQGSTAVAMPRAGSRTRGRACCPSAAAAGWALRSSVIAS